MQARSRWSRHLFHAGILLMLGAGIPAAIAWSEPDAVLIILALAGAILAVGARGWQRRLSLGVSGTDDGLGGYPLSLLRDPRFTSGRGARA